MPSAMQKLTRQLVLGGIRTGFGLGEIISPSLAARYAEQMFFSVPRPPVKARRDRGVVPAETLTVTTDGLDLQVHAWGDGPTVFLVHGWSAWWQQFSVYVEPLTAAGFRVLTWDSPSHGDAPPGRFGVGRSALPEMADAFRAVADQAGAPSALIAHSGGAMAASLSIIDGLAVDRAVLIAPSVSVDDVVAMLRRRLGWGERTAGIMLDNIARTYGVDPWDYDVPKLLARHEGQLPEVLILHDIDDPDTPAAGGRRLAEMWPGSSYVETQGLGHHKLMWNAEIIEQIVEFVAGGRRSSNQP